MEKNKPLGEETIIDRIGRFFVAIIEIIIVGAFIIGCLVFIGEILENNHHGPSCTSPEQCEADYYENKYRSEEQYNY